MSEKDTIEINSSKADEIDEKIDKGQEKVDEKLEKGQEKVNEKIDKGQEKVNEKINDKKDKINDTFDQGKQIADKVANDLSKGVDEFFDNVKTAHKKFNDKVNDYKQTVIETLDIDLIEDKGNYYIKVATPGVAKENIEIEAGDYEITIEAIFPSFKDEIDAAEDAELILDELKEGKCVKSISFANQINIHEIKAAYDNGMTIITIPKVETPKTKVTVE
ncbi:MAG: Hsp20/alpha crystallin family protein [Methanobrevibacter sp.]|uniref:Hsp20/alpha crystallin family protein n=1 Tax=Methanobrevibacter sp. TaxID=66852 RepID=UPI0026DECE7B|nr:Hsp20/alpha crystallin family protein [Methanobrevibacter sp.]MDO5848281.1 Hsp20/alpha crystallin family protein [Methanobrevibacter sp.]